MIPNPNNWTTTTLDQLANFRGGVGFPEHLQGRKEGDFPFYKVSDMNRIGNEKHLFLSENYVDSDLAIAMGWNIFPAGSVVFAKVGAAVSLNRRRILTQDSLIDNNMMAAIPLGEITTEWIYWWLLNFDMNSISKPGPVPSISQSQMNELVVNLPELCQERQRIVEVLEHVEYVQHTHLELYRKMKKIREGLLSDMFTRGVDDDGIVRSPETHDFVDSPTGFRPAVWDTVLVGDLLHLQYGYSLPEHSWTGDGFPVVGSGGITGENGEYSVEGPCVVVGRKGSIGEVYWVDENCTPIDTTFFVEPIGDNSMRYLYYLLNYLPLQKMIIQVGTPGLRRSEVYETVVSSISPQEQERIVSILDGINRRIEFESTLLVKYQKIKNGLMSDLLTGRRRIPASLSDGRGVLA